VHAPCATRPPYPANAERYSAAATDARELELRRRKEVQFLQTLAAHALEGGLGEPPMPLAEALLFDEAGVPAADERALREFALALRRLGHSQ
jgi:hypothetical protein